jgi:gram positive anchor domain protein
MNKLKKISMAAFGMLATVAPATAVFADETPTTVDNSTPVETKPSENVGRVNYVYKVKGTDTEIGKGYKEGVIGEDYVINPEVLENYKYSGVEGETTGKFSNETPTITFYYESTTAEAPSTTEQPKEEKPAEDKKDNTDKKKDDVEPSTSTTTPSTDKKDDVTTTTPSTTLKPVEKPADKPKEEEKPVEVKPTIEKPVETNTGDKIVGATDKGQVIVANDKGETTVVAPEKVGGEVKSDGSIQVKDKSGKLVKIPTTGVEAALVSIMLAGGSASTAGIASFLRSKRNK